MRYSAGGNPASYAPSESAGIMYDVVEKDIADLEASADYNPDFVARLKAETPPADEPDEHEDGGGADLS